MSHPPPTGWLARLVLARRRGHHVHGPRPFSHFSSLSTLPRLAAVPRTTSGSFVVSSRAFASTPGRLAAAAASVAGTVDGDRNEAAPPSPSSPKRRSMRKRAGGGARAAARALPPAATAAVPTAEPAKPAPTAVPPPTMATEKKRSAAARKAAIDDGAEEDAAKAENPVGADTALAAAQGSRAGVPDTKATQSPAKLAPKASTAATTATSSPTPTSTSTSTSPPSSVHPLPAAGKPAMTANSLLSALKAKKMKQRQLSLQRQHQKEDGEREERGAATATTTTTTTNAATVQREEEGEEEEDTVSSKAASPAARAGDDAKKSTTTTTITPTAAGMGEMQEEEADVAPATSPPPSAVPSLSAASSNSNNHHAETARRSSSRGNRATKRRAGQSKGRGRKRNKREGDEEAEGADGQDAASVAVAEAAQAIDEVEKGDVEAAVGQPAAATEGEDEMEDVLDASHEGQEEDISADAAVEKAQAAIDAAVAAAMAADGCADAAEATTTFAVDEEAEQSPAVAPDSTRATVAATAIDALDEGAAATASSPLAPEPKKKPKKKKRKGRKTSNLAAGKAAEVMVNTGASAAEEEGEGDSDKPAAGMTAATAADLPVAEEDATAAASAEAEKGQPEASLEDDEGEMELIFADSWLPPRGQRAIDRDASAADVEGEDELAGAAESADVEVSMDEGDIAAAAEVEAAAEPARKIKGKRSAKKRIAAAATGGKQKPIAATPATEEETELAAPLADATPLVGAKVAIAEEQGAAKETSVSSAEVAEAGASLVDTAECEEPGAAASSVSTGRTRPTKMSRRSKRILRRLLVKQLYQMLLEQQERQRMDGSSPTTASPPREAKRRSTSASADASGSVAPAGEEKATPPAIAPNKAVKKKAKMAASRAKVVVVADEEAEVTAAAAEDTAAADTDAATTTTAATTASVTEAQEPEEGAEMCTLLEVDEDDVNGAEAKALEAEVQRIAAELLHAEEGGGGEGVPSQQQQQAKGSCSDEDGAAAAPDVFAATAKPSGKSLRAMILRASSTTAAAPASATAAKKSSSSSSSSGATGASGGGGKTAGSSSGGGKKGSNSNPLFFPDYREQVLIIFQQLAEINAALGERYKTASYTTATEKLKKNDTIFKILPPHLKAVEEKELAASGRKEEVLAFLEKRKYVRDASRPIPGVGDKLRKKIVEILQTGDLKELHTLKQKPLIRAIQELTQVHGFGPRTAISFYKDYGISSVEELKKYAKAHGEDFTLSSPPPAGKQQQQQQAKKKGFHLTDAQRLGLRYHEEIQQRIPHAEGRLHEAYLKLKVRKHLGKHYDITVCGSYRRKCETSGDIDVLITPKAGALHHSPASAGEDPFALSKNALATFVAALKSEKYMEATLAQGPTKFMGICRLRSLSSPNKKVTKRFCARRIDIRFVDAASFPAALLYFTGSKNFNVVMRAEAIKKNFILNEYGLFKNNSRDTLATSKLHEMISKLAKAQFYTSKSALKSSRAGKGVTAADAAASSSSSATAGDDDVEEDEEEEEDHTAATGGSAKAAGGGGGVAGKGKKELSKKQLTELREISKKVESLRVKVSGEADIFDAIGMEYVHPVDRNI